MGTTQSAASSAGSTQGMLRSMAAKIGAHPGCWWNLNWTINPAQGKSYAKAASAASKGGGSATQALHCVKVCGRGSAQVLQRCAGCPKRWTQGSQTGLAGQA